jgi:hypothetical protein
VPQTGMEYQSPERGGRRISDVLAAARAEALRIQEISQENEGYCAKWQMGLGTKMHDQCILDLQELRWKAQNRFADQLDF